MRNQGAEKKFDKPKDFKGTLKNLLLYLKPYRIAFSFVVVFAIGSAAFSIVGPKILGKATTEIFNGLVAKVTGTGNGINFNHIGKIAIGLLILYIISALLAFLQGYIVSGITQKISYKLRKSIAEKMNRMPLGYFDRKSHGEILSRITNDVDTVSQNLNQTMTQVITAITTIIGVLIMMLSISPLMTLVSLLILPISGVLITIIVKKSQGYFKNQQVYLGHMNGHIEEIYSGHTIVKAFNGEEKAMRAFDEINESLYETSWKSQFLSGMMMPIMTFIGNLGYVFVSILGGYLAIRKTIEVGDILSFIQYVRSFMQPIAQTAQVANMLQGAVAAAERVFEFLDETEEIDIGSEVLDHDTVKGEVAFRNVQFGYNPDNIIIKHFSVDVKPGQTVAIVGPTGAGKTTLVKLLMRFYDTNSGQILIDGKDITKLKREDLRNIFGMVLQDTWLFNGTILENIRYGNLKATEEDVKEAAKAAHAHHFIKTLPDGYNMALNEEASNVSQGQKQLLTIARAILSNPKILILDEATSSVDTRTELLIQKAMHNLMKDRTSFVIAHRLSTIKDADLILVMKDGDIVEQGSHEKLLAANGFYTTLYNSQFSE
ncbi:MAG: ABC transporter ATP-binding protein [Cellulosilyticaceae bacterium]